MNILQPDRETVSPGKFFFINFAEQKSSIRFDRSKNIKKYGGRETYKVNSWVEDDQIIADAFAHSDVDLWMESDLQHAFFMSDKLATSLAREKLKAPWRMKRCLIEL